MEYAWQLDTIAALNKHRKYLEQIMDDVIEQKTIAIEFIRNKLKAQGVMRVYDNNLIEYIDEEGHPKEYRWSDISREGEEMAQYITPLKRYRWFEKEYTKTGELLKEKITQLSETFKSE